MLWKTIYADRIAAMEAAPEDPESIETQKVKRSANWMARHFEDYPILLFGFAQGDPTGGSIFPAIWSAMLAARAHGVGSALTSLLSMYHPKELNALLGIPTAEGWSCAATVSFGYPTGRWGVAPRRPAHEVSGRNGWNGDVGFEVGEPLFEV